jgi:hypothetical protein
MPVPTIPEAAIPVTIPGSIELNHARALLVLCKLNRERAGKDNPLGLVEFKVWTEACYDQYGLNFWSHCTDLVYKYKLAHGAPRQPGGNSFRPAPAIAIEPAIALRELNRIEEEHKMVVTPEPEWFDPEYVEQPKGVAEDGTIVQTPAGPARLVRQADGTFQAIPVSDGAAVAARTGADKKGEERREDANPKRSGATDPKAPRGA